MDKATINSLIVFFKQSLKANGMQDYRIALFGSALSGNMHKDSDIDMIIISKSFAGKDIFERAKMTTQPERDTIRKFKIPLDILTMSPVEYEYSQTAFFKSKIVA
jgi:predicted nucleotidyltransferase